MAVPQPPLDDAGFVDVCRIVPQASETDDGVGARIRACRVVKSHCDRRCWSQVESAREWPFQKLLTCSGAVARLAVWQSDSNCGRCSRG